MEKGITCTSSFEGPEFKTFHILSTEKECEDQSYINFDIEKSTDVSAGIRFTVFSILAQMTNRPEYELW